MGNARQGWSQQTLLPPEHVRIELTAHYEAGSDYVQVGVHVTDHLDDTTIALYTRKVKGFDTARDELMFMLDSAVSEHVHPF